MVSKNAHKNNVSNLDSYDLESFDFDKLEASIENNLEDELKALDLLKDDREKIGNPDNLGEVVKNIVWEQFINQVGAVAGEDFIKENRGLTLDLSKDAHYQTTDNFEKGKIATHNTEIDFQKRYDDYQGNFKKDDSGRIVTHKTRSGQEKATLNKDARAPYDMNRPKGNIKKQTDMDHTIPADEYIRDPAANAHMTLEERVKSANSKENLREMNSSHNRSKGDKTMDEWLNNPNSKGQKPDEIFNDLTEEKKEEYRKNDKEARRKKEEDIKKGEAKSTEAGKISRKKEAVRIGKASLKSAIMVLLAELVKTIIGKLVKWFKSNNKSLSTLGNTIKDSIKAFVLDLKKHLKSAGSAVVSTIITSIGKPLLNMIKKFWAVLKMGWKSLKDAYNYLKDPSNKDKPISIRIMEIGKLIIGTLTAGGAILLSEAIEKSLMTIPILVVEIPLIGSLASLLGIFFGAVGSGIIGALLLNFIDKKIASKQKSEADKKVIKQNNKILSLQEQQKILVEERLEFTKSESYHSVQSRHTHAENMMRTSLNKIMEESIVPLVDQNTTIIIDEEDIQTNSKLKNISKDLESLL